MEEMLDDTMETLDDDDEMEEEAQEEVDKVLYELTAGKVYFRVLLRKYCSSNANKTSLNP